MGETGKESNNSEVNKIMMNDVFIEMSEKYAEFAGMVEFCPYCGTAIGIKGEEFDDVIDGEWVPAKGEWAIKGCWEQLPLWSQSELDHL